MSGSSFTSTLPTSPARFDWFQDENTITLNIYEPSVEFDSVKFQLDGKKLSISFHTQRRDGDKEHTKEPVETKSVVLNLSSHIKDPNDGSENSRVSVTERKLEIKLFKREAGLWNKLEESSEDKQNPPNLADSYTKVTRTPPVKFSDKFLDEESDEPAPEPNSEEQFIKLLQDIYSKGDDKTRRAMVKSFTASSGKVLSTNWDDVKDQQFN